MQQRLEQSGGQKSMAASMDTSSSQPDLAQVGAAIEPDSHEKRQIEHWKSEVEKMKYLLDSAERDHEEKMKILIMEEKHMKEENTRLRRRLQQEAERREEICRNLSESESSLEIDTERYVQSEI